MSLFLVLGTALIALLTRALDFLDAGTGGTEIQDKANDFLIPFKSDVEGVIVERSLMPGEPAIRFHCDFVDVDSDGDGNNDYRAQRLVFVRSNSREGSDPVARMSGTKPGADAYLDGTKDVEEAEAGTLRALRGMEEVLYIALPDDPANPAVLTLYRGTRSPPGGRGTLFDAKTPAQIKGAAQPLLKGVLHFGVAFWTPRSTDWNSNDARTDGNSPVVTWDSTRGVLQKGRNPGRNEFPFARGPKSLNDPRDDISPRSLRVSFVFKRTGRESFEGQLMQDLNEGGRKATVDNTGFAAGAALDFIKIGTEWMTFSSRTDEVFSLSSRGARGTIPSAHERGDMVHCGASVVRTIIIPSYREDWNFSR
jgi:hypothetical protein